MSETDPELDHIIRDLVEWMDGWENHTSNLGNSVIKFEDREEFCGHMSVKCSIEDFKDSLDLIRGIEEAVVRDFPYLYQENLMLELDEPITSGITHCDWFIIDGAMADPEPRLRALYRTLREEGEIE
jgi:hypothetical protein